MNDPAPFFADMAQAPPGARAFWLEAGDGARIRAAVWPAPAGGEGRGTAVVFPGRTEFVEKYGRMVGRLVARGLAVAVLDWRGQGLSDRLGSTPLLGHVEDFREYQHDVAALIAAPEFAALPRPLTLFAHSMGGCIGLRTLLERSEFAAAVFSAPMWQLHLRSATRQITSSLAQLAHGLGLGPRLMPGANRDPSALALAFQNNVLTSDAEHFDWFGRQLAAHPELGLGGPSVQWTRAALEEMARLYVAPLPGLPVLTLLGTAESVVSSRVIRTRMAEMAQGGLVVLDGARHEIWMERSAIQARVWAETDAFLARRPPSIRSA